MTDETDALRERLNLLVPINNLVPAQRDQVLNAAELLEVKKKEFVFHQGDRDNFSVFVLEGEIELFADDQLIKRVVGGEAASFQALAQLQPRQMSAQAKSKAKILKVDRGLLDRLLSADASSNDEDSSIEVTEFESDANGAWLMEMLQSDLFAHVPPSNIQQLLETLESVEVKAGDVVIEQGAIGDFYYAIQSGRCEVLRAVSNKKEFKLAELGPGDRFGEEALVSSAKRNATVKMLTDGELARLTKEDFVELIKKPVLRTVTLEQARESTSAGAKWLDVRFPEEHSNNGLPDSLNVPLSNLRNSLRKLDKETHYIAYCDTGGRSSSAAFLLTQAGFEVSYIESGAIDEVSNAPATTRKTAAAPSVDAQVSPPAPKPAPPSPPPIKDEASLDAEVRAQSLAADLEKAKIQIEQAQRLMAEANAAKAQADRLVAEKLESERAKIDQQAANIAAQIAAEKEQAAAQIEQERAKLEADTATVVARLEEAERLKDEIARQQSEAAAEAEQRQREREAQIETLRREAEHRMQEEERRVEELYRQQAEKLEEIERERSNAKAELERTWTKLEAESLLSQERLQAAEKLESSLAEVEAERKRKLQEQEAQMRAALQAELAEERKKLEAEFARTAKELERAQREQEAAEAAKRGAAEEAQRIIAEYKSEHEKLQADQFAMLIAEREKLQQDAIKLQRQLEQAADARNEAEALKREAEAQLQATKDRQATVEASEDDLLAEIEAIEARANAATERLRSAVLAENQAEESMRKSEERLERTYGTEKEINLLLQQELDDWVAEQELVQSSTAGRDTMEKRLRQTERIKERAVEAQHATKQHTANLLDEIAAQLDGNA